MELSVPTNWEIDLLQDLNKTKVTEIYGKPEGDAVGGAHASALLPRISKSAMVKYLSLIRKYGLKFNYLLNSAVLKEKILKKNFRKVNKAPFKVGTV